MTIREVANWTEVEVVVQQVPVCWVLYLCGFELQFQPLSKCLNVACNKRFQAVYLNNLHIMCNILERMYVWKIAVAQLNYSRVVALVRLQCNKDVKQR